MSMHSSAIALERAQAVINDRSIEPKWRALVRYALKTNDPWLAEFVRRTEAGEMNIDAIDFSQAPETSATIEQL